MDVLVNSRRRQVEEQPSREPWSQELGESTRFKEAQPGGASERIVEDECCLLRPRRDSVSGAAVARLVLIQFSMGFRFLKRRERPGSCELARRGQAMELIGLLASWAMRKRRKDVG
jgi:hypothetical protein